MAIYNKPGVYVEETLTPNLPVVQSEAASVAAFIGVADRGPTTVVNNAVVAVPTLITNFSDFTRQFSFDNVVNTFSGANVGTSAEDLKYAAKTFFDNGGGQAYIVRAVNTDAVKATAVFRNSDSQTVQSVSWEFDGTTNIAANKLTITATSGTPFASFEAGRLVNFSGVTATNYTFLNSSTWVVSSIESSGSGLSIVWNNENPVTAVSQTTGVTVSGGATSSVATLTATAKDHGAWGGNSTATTPSAIWVGVEPDSTENYFNLSVYYSTTATASTQLTSTNRVERFTSLSMDSTNARYFVNIIGSNSNWITVSDNAAASTGRYDLPAFTGYWGTAITSANINETNGSFVWNTASFSTATLSAAKLGNTGTTVVTLAGVAGSNGSTAPNLASQVLARLDAVSAPLILNYPGVSTTATINGLLNYAATRSDSFVVIDAKNDTVANVLSTTTDVGIGSYANNLNYGAAYYPYIVIADPASTTGATKTIAPGGAVAALYASTDDARGVFKAPAGSNAIVRSAVSVSALTNEEFDLISGGQSNLNVIRFVPGSGICVMGARTLSSLYSDKYVPVRRTLNYLSNTLKNATAFAVFEPNNATLWNTVTGTVRGILSDFWNEGGLFGETEEEAFYVKCDETINTSQVIASGELRVEVGVALLRPAEFVIIKLGQIDGGATVTTSI
jgi:phage tail sheath protein FI